MVSSLEQLRPSIAVAELQAINRCKPSVFGLRPEPSTVTAYACAECIKDQIPYLLLSARRFRLRETLALRLDFAPQ